MQSVICSTTFYCKKSIKVTFLSQKMFSPHWVYNLDQCFFLLPSYCFSELSCLCHIICRNDRIGLIIRKHNYVSMLTVQKRYAIVELENEQTAVKVLQGKNHTIYGTSVIIKPRFVAWHMAELHDFVDFYAGSASMVLHINCALFH